MIETIEITYGARRRNRSKTNTTWMEEIPKKNSKESYHKKNPNTIKDEQVLRTMQLIEEKEKQKRFLEQ